MTEPRKPSKEELFARGFLSGIGLSPEYAAIIAERIMVPGTKLSPSDAEYLLEAAGLPTSKIPVDETPTVPAPPLGTGLEPYEELLGDRGGYLRAPLTLSLTLLTLALW